MTVSCRSRASRSRSSADGEFAHVARNLAWSITRSGGAPEGVDEFLVLGAEWFAVERSVR